jgi:hypothetical protein
VSRPDAVRRWRPAPGRHPLDQLQVRTGLGGRRRDGNDRRTKARGGRRPRHRRHAALSRRRGGDAAVLLGRPLRYREEDFAPPPALCGDSGGPRAVRLPHARAPVRRRRADPRRIGGPRRSVRSATNVLLSQPPALAPVSARIAGVDRSLGLTSFRLPLAISQRPSGARGACTGCATCDTFACAVSAKNDVATPRASRLPDQPPAGRPTFHWQSPVAAGLAENLAISCPSFRQRRSAVVSWSSSIAPRH